MRKYYDEDDEEDYGKLSRREAMIQAALPPEKLGVVDLLLACGVGALVFAGLCAFPFPGLCPDAWDAAAVAAGLRPPAEILPGLWRVLARLFYLGNVSAGNVALMWAGRVCAGMTAASAYVLLRSALSLLVRGRMRYAVRRHLVQRVAAGLGAVFFACGDSVWRMGQTFTPGGLLTLLTCAQLAFFLRFLLNGRMFCGGTATVLAGVLAAETPFGFALLAGCICVGMLGLRQGALCARLPLLDSVRGTMAKWALTLAWALGLIAGIALNCGSFIAMEGLTASGGAVGDMPLMYLLGWWRLLMGAANGMGWILGLGVCALPCAVAAAMLPRALDEDHFQPYHVGAVFFCTGALAFSQLAMLPPLWFWTWSDAVALNSDYLQHLFMLAAAGTVAAALTTLSGDACCRNHRQLANLRFADLREEAGGTDVANALPRGGIVVFFVVAALLVAGALPGRALTRTREMLRLIEDYAQEVVAECGPVHWIFTDGSFDARLELGAAQAGHPIKALAMMRGNDPYQQYLRRRGVTDAEDLMSLALGAPMTLRSWMRDKPERMKDAAVQLGFELWKRDGKELPVCSGVLARPVGMSAEDCAAGVARSAKLADRILDVYATGGLEKAAGKTIRELFLFVQWRLARLARMRAERADRAGDTQTAMADVKLSDRLDDVNASLKRILADMEKQRATTLKQITPRESLQLALARADFTLARRYGEVILEVDADDPHANFGVGMSYVMQKQWSRAEDYLRRGLVKRPKEPAMWNNLAMVCMYQNRFDEAEKNARRALDLIPESAEVKDTLKKIAEARKAAAEKAKPGDAKPGDKASR